MKKDSSRVKREPLKIVYIGNPRKFKAKNYSEFLKIVQQYTAQDPETKTSNPSDVGIVKRTPNGNRKSDGKKEIVSMNSSSSYAHQEMTYRPSMDGAIAYYPSSGTGYVNEDSMYPSSSTEFGSRSDDSLNPSSSSEYVDEEFSQFNSAATDPFGDDFFSVDMLQQFEGFQYL
ncbi:hypothetical protein ACHQM5_014410 [Ranunculus cassubicifolius]